MPYFTALASKTCSIRAACFTPFVLPRSSIRYESLPRSHILFSSTSQISIQQLRSMSLLYAEYGVISAKAEAGGGQYCRHVCFMFCFHRGCGNRSDHKYARYCKCSCFGVSSKSILSMLRNRSCIGRAGTWKYLALHNCQSFFVP